MGRQLTREMYRRKRPFAPDTLMFNLNGHPYYGLDEMEQVWAFYTDNIDNGLPELWDYRIFVEGDLAYITSEGVSHRARRPTRAGTRGTWRSARSPASTKRS